MGKKGVMLDNGKTAQSSMALYWKKNRQMSRNNHHNHEKKQPKIDQEEQFEQKATSGFEKWKLHKQKAITKAYQKKPQKKQKQVAQQKEQKEQEFVQMIQEPKREIKLLGYRSKDHLKKKFQVQMKKEVDQSDNILKLPGELSNLSQDDIGRIIRQKNAKRTLESNRRKNHSIEKEDVILDEQWMKKEEPPAQEPQKEQEVQEKQEQIVFKSDILAELSRGNMQVLKQKVQEKPIQIQQKVQQVQEISAVRKPLFKPRALGNK